MTNTLQLNLSSTIKLDGAEISDFDPKSKRLFVTGETAGKPVIQVEVSGEKKTFQPEEISSMVLTKMKDIAEAFIDEKVTSNVFKEINLKTKT